MRTIEFTEAGAYCVQPDIGGIPNTTVIEVTWDEAWTGKENCLSLVNGVVTFIPNMHYIDDRRHEYPEIGDQLDALFHAGVFPAEMAAEIQAVKDKYPK